jgi:transcriptional antiterminator RfaH
VLTTHARREVYAAHHLQRQGFAVYAPKILKRVSHARKIQDMPRPMFPGYLFVEINHAAAWRPLASTFGVRGVVRFGDRPAILPATFIEELRAREIDGLVARPPSPFSAGDRVRVVRGMFEGTIAEILRVDEHDRVVLLLELLQQQVAAKFDVAAVVKHDAARVTGASGPPKSS